MWGMVAVGGTIICLHKVEASTIYSLMDRHGVTHMSGAPVVLNILTKSPDVETLKNPVHIIVKKEEIIEREERILLEREEENFELNLCLLLLCYFTHYACSVYNYLYPLLCHVCMYVL